MKRRTSFAPTADGSVIVTREILNGLPGNAGDRRRARKAGVEPDWRVTDRAITRLLGWGRAEAASRLIPSSISIADMPTSEPPEIRRAREIVAAVDAAPAVAEALAVLRATEEREFCRRSGLCSSIYDEEEETVCAEM